jgi:two-component system OmpR family response regulator
MLNAGRVLSKAQILDHVWKFDFQGDSGIVETSVNYLPRKLDGPDGQVIQTVPGAGYLLRTAT